MKATEPVGILLPVAEATVALNVTALFMAGEREEACSEVVVDEGVTVEMGTGALPAPPHPLSIKPEARSKTSAPE